MFHVGQRVVCIADDWITIPGEFHLTRPVKGCVYSIREIGPANDTLVLHFEEIINDPRPCIDRDGSLTTAEPGFSSHNFRPVKDTDISMFTKLLAPTPEEIASIAPKGIKW